MKIYISVDMEGCAGVVDVDQCRRAGSDFEKARVWMTDEANAAALGAFDAGAEGVLVNDSHADMHNLLLERMDPRVEVLSGWLKPLSMVQGAGPEFGAALFVGYHAGAGTQAGVLDHTYYGRVVARLRLGGRDFNETALNALVCGSLGVPVALVTGDAACVRQAREVLGDEVGTVCTKEAFTRFSARSLSPARACSLIREAAAQAVTRAMKGGLKPFLPPAPYALEVDFVNSACADAAELVPGTRRAGGTTAAYSAPDARTLLQVIQAWTKLAGTALV